MRKMGMVWALLAGWAMGAQAAEVTVAVAANFAAPLQKIAARFEQGHRAQGRGWRIGATGAFLRPDQQRCAVSGAAVGRR
jgi:ABC-type molybdate transport system substrate-binding protein